MGVSDCSVGLVLALHVVGVILIPLSRTFSVALSPPFFIYRPFEQRVSWLLELSTPKVENR
jgi:hypothetical protein